MSEQTNGGGVPAPNHTQTPNTFYDDLLPLMHESELKVTLVIIRQTFGWHRDRHLMSLSFLEKATGLSRQGVIDGIDAGLERGTIGREPSGQSFLYFLLVNEVDQQPRAASQQSRPVTTNQSTELTSTSQQSRPELVNGVDPKKETKEKQQKKDGGSSSTIFALYEDEKFGKLTALAAEEIQADIEDYGEEAVIEAIKIAVRSNVRKWSYVQGILRKQAADESRPTGPDRFLNSQYVEDYNL